MPPAGVKTACVFPGQGSQHVGMGRELYEKYSARVEPFYQRAHEALGFDLRELIFFGPEEKLKLTEFAQPAILLDSVIKFELLGQRPDYAAGHSLGEYSALVCAGVFSLEEGLRLVHLRGRLMQEVVPPGQGSMVALLKVDAERVQEICVQTGAELANYNSPEQIVISGRREAVLRAKALAEALGGKGIELAVSAPFHSSLMKPAEERLKPEIEKIPFSKPAFPVISTVSGEPETDPDRMKALLMRQITAPVRWADYVLKLKALGVGRFIEVGPGDVLTKLIRRIDKESEALSFAQVMP
ncbi:MAG: ACP S-malonyltransferase [Candidatus Bipolaricaulota bacterium]|nr:ACP S-malonyltransferase [Candidatus Bipolaricaulota bacterium]MDW8031373.1 ACP S-malonyltransferase [Candidatus Bipolaricaulota bacterium]